MTTPQSPSYPLTHHVVFTIPRTASHLLLKLLNLPAQSSVYRHPNNQDGYIFLPAASPRFRYALPGKPVQEYTDAEKTALKDAMQSSFTDWLHHLEAAEHRGKSTFVKEHLNWIADPTAEARLFGHPPSDPSAPAEFQVAWTPDAPRGAQSELNVTCLPDAFLRSRIKPTFLIRHPALTFPSNLRTAIAGEGIQSVLGEEKIHRWECTYHWSLSLYHFYVQSAAGFDRRSLVDGVEYPIVLDAQDLGDEALVKKYADAVGLRAEHVRFAWEAAGEEELSRLGGMERKMKGTILASRGVEKEKLRAEALDVENLRAGWEREFGEVLSERLVGSVSDSMEAYEALRSVRLRV